MGSLWMSMILAVSFARAASAEGPREVQGDASPPGLVLRYSPIDLPFAFHASGTFVGTPGALDAPLPVFPGMRYISMEQSLQIYIGLNSAAAWAIRQIPVFPEHPLLRTGTHALILGVFDGVVYITRPPYLGRGWLHEEWHRAVLVTRHASSTNAYELWTRDGLLGGGSFSVLDVQDKDLIWMKAHDNPSLARMSAAGAEAQFAASARMQREDFFYGRPRPQSLHYVLNTRNVVNALRLCADEATVTGRSLLQIEREGARQDLRDAKGLDFTAWAYDLFNPELPYAARGRHRHGDGIDRYIYGDKLSADQYAWLEKQSRLAFIGYVSPLNLLVASIPLRRGDTGGLRGNFAFRYSPTSFGNRVGVEVLLQADRANLVVAAHLNQNHAHSFPSIEAMLFEKPLTVSTEPLLLSLHVEVGKQPAGQGFYTSEGVLVGAVEAVGVWHRGDRLAPFVTVSAKSRGWVMGDPFLDPHLGLQLGVSSRWP